MDWIPTDSELRDAARILDLETEIEYLRKGPQGDAWQRTWDKRDLAVAEAVMEACLRRSGCAACMAGDPVEIEEGLTFHKNDMPRRLALCTAHAIRALDLDAIVKGVKS